MHVMSNLEVTDLIRHSTNIIHNKLQGLAIKIAETKEHLKLQNGLSATVH